MSRSFQTRLILFICLMLLCSSLTAYASIEQSSNIIHYTIQKGDTLYLLSKRFHTTIDQISAQNPKLNPKNLQIGSKVNIPLGTGIIAHPVKKGDTLWKIAKKYNSKVNEIASKNFIKNPNVIYEGDFLAIPESISKEEMETISALQKQVVNEIKEKDFEGLANYVHPKKGVRFTPYGYVSVEHDLTFSAEQITKFGEDKKKYIWGYQDGSGFPIDYTPMQYFDGFVYGPAVTRTDKVSYNKIIGTGNNFENLNEVYPGSIFVEYYYGGSKENTYFDWASLRLVFEKYNDRWYLVALIHNQWTI